MRCIMDGCLLTVSIVLLPVLSLAASTGAMPELGAARDTAAGLLLSGLTMAVMVVLKFIQQKALQMRTEHK